MPEGDTILRAARTLSLALAGKTVARVASPLPAIADAGLVGRRVDAVTAHGKNLLVRFDDGRTLHTHMRMTGSWHLYRPGEPWRKSAQGARVVLEVMPRDGASQASAPPSRGGKTDADGGFVAVCFSAPVVRLLAADLGDVELGRLGPDILAPTFDEAEAHARLRALGACPIGEALLVQSAVAGIGNIYKSESLFAQRLDPWAPVARLEDAALAAVVAEARRLMQRNVVPGQRMRTTTTSHVGGPRYAVYGRSGLPCTTCGARIAMRRQGTALRSTYYCPTCQAPRAPEAKGASPVRT